jgi:hypothetical protein
MDEYSEVLGMTPREHERRMRKWYVLLAIVGFFGVFGEGILVMLSKRRHEQDARRAAGTPSVQEAPAPGAAAPGASAPGAGAPNAVPR